MRKFVIAAVAAAMTAIPAQAITLTSLKGSGLDHIYGRYAPGGNCTRLPRMAIDDSGFAFQTADRTVRSQRFEYAISFMGPTYDGISAVFFPFPVNDANLGPVIMTVNADEQPGIIRLESDLPRGQKLSPPHAALVAASPLKRCAK